VGGGERDLSPSAWLFAIVSAQRRGDLTGIKLDNRLELLILHGHHAVLTHDRKAGFDRSPEMLKYQALRRLPVQHVDLLTHE